MLVNQSDQRDQFGHLSPELAYVLMLGRWVCVFQKVFESSPIYIFQQHTVRIPLFPRPVEADHVRQNRVFSAHRFVSIDFVMVVMDILCGVSLQ
jgi:hypothetical protein